MNWMEPAQQMESKNFQDWSWRSKGSEILEKKQ